MVFTLVIAAAFSAVAPLTTACGTRKQYYIVANQRVPALAELFLGIRDASFFGTVNHIIALSTRYKVLWVKALRIVTCVAHAEQKP